MSEGLAVAADPAGFHSTLGEPVESKTNRGLERVHGVEMP